MVSTCNVLLRRTVLFSGWRVKNACRLILLPHIQVKSLTYKLIDMKKVNVLLAMVSAIFLFYGCAAYRQQMALDMFGVELGMSKEDLVGTLGRPNLIISAYTADNGDMIEVWEYVRQEQNSLTDQVEARPIWTYFVNNELFEWGPGENWETDAAFRRAILNRSQDYKMRRTNR